MLHYSGVPLFTNSYEKGIDCCSEEHRQHNALNQKSSLFSSFLTSINAIAAEFGGPLRHLKLGRWDVFVDSSGNTTGVLMTTPSDDHSIHHRYTNTLKQLKSSFLKEFEEQLRRWNGEISQFRIFENILDNHKIIKEDLDSIDLCVKCMDEVNSALEDLTN